MNAILTINLVNDENFFSEESIFSVTLIIGDDIIHTSSMIESCVNSLVEAIDVCYSRNEKDVMNALNYILIKYNNKITMQYAKPFIRALIQYDVGDVEIRK